jgi:hypothetical protein
MVFDESYYKERNISDTREDRMKHHAIEMRKAVVTQSIAPYI